MYLILGYSLICVAVKDGDHDKKYLGFRPMCQTIQIFNVFLCWNQRLVIMLINGSGLIGSLK